jgi:hypothetical protein
VHNFQKHSKAAPIYPDESNEEIGITQILKLQLRVTFFSNGNKHASSSTA